LSRRLPAAERRQQILAIARTVFGVDGYHATSMNAVAEAAGVTKPVLYQHFESKEHLYLELVRDVAEDLRTVVREALATAEGPRRQVEAGFAAYFRFFAADPAAFRVLFGDTARSEPAFASEVITLERDIADFVAGFFPEDFPPDDRLLLAHGMVGLAESTSRYWRDLLPEAEADVVAAKVAQMAWVGVRGRPQGEPSPDGASAEGEV
jgi:AcrR family transcriptional regulator